MAFVGVIIIFHVEILYDAHGVFGFTEWIHDADTVRERMAGIFEGFIEPDHFICERHAKNKFKLV